MMVNDNPNDSTIRPTDNKAWDQSLTRNVTMTVLKILRMVEDQEINMVNGVQQASCLSKQAFYNELADTMSNWRRKDGDSTCGIVWFTQKSKRFGPQFSNNKWNCVVAVISITGGIMPTLVISPSSNRRNRPTIDIDEALGDCHNSFLNEITFKRVSIVNILLMRVIIFVKLHMEKKSKDMEPLENVGLFKGVLKERLWLIKDELHLRFFYLTEKDFEMAIHNTFFRAGRYTRASDNSKDVPHRIHAVSNMQDWDIDGGDYRSLFRYSTTKPRCEPDLLELQKMIERNRSPQGIAKFCVERMIITEECVRYLSEYFDEFKQGLETDLMANYEETVQRAKKRRSRKGKVQEIIEIDN